MSKSDQLATTISREAVRVALSCVLPPNKKTAGSVLESVLVLESRVMSTDGRRAVIVSSADADGMFDKGERIALVPREQLRDAARGRTDHMHVSEKGRLEAFNEDGDIVRTCPFEAGPVEDFPDITALQNKGRQLVCRFSPALLGELLIAMARAGAGSVALYDAGPSDVCLEFRAELPNGATAVGLIARVKQEKDAPLPVPMPDPPQAAADGPNAVEQLEGELDRRLKTPPEPMGKDETDKAIKALADAATGKGKRRGKRGVAS